MPKKRFTTLTLGLFLCLPLFAQFHFEAGINYANSSKMIAGVGTYIEPRYALNDNTDLALHLGLTGFIGEDQSRTKSSRITTGTLPIFLMGLIRHFPTKGAKGVPYLGFGPGLYLSKGINFREGVKLGAGLRFGVFIGRSNIGFTQNFVPDDSFFQLNYGFRILNRD